MMVSIPNTFQNPNIKKCEGLRFLDIEMLGFHLAVGHSYLKLNCVRRLTTIDYS